MKERERKEPFQVPDLKNGREYEKEEEEEEEVVKKREEEREKKKTVPQNKRTPAWRQQSVNNARLSLRRL